MADDLDSIGTFEIFPLAINWVKRPKLDLALARILVKHVGTVSDLETFIEDVPEQLTFGVSVTSQSDEYDLLDFFMARRGKHGRFWIKRPSREFTLKENILSGSSAILVYRNGAYTQYQGYERIWIEMHNGDILTRHIPSIVDDDLNDRYSLNLATPLARDLNIDNHFIISRLLLVRFTEDKLFLELETDVVSEITLTVRELVKEYTAI